MKSGKVIDVSKSSLVSLKAELLRKQEEAQRSKGSETYIRPAPKKKKQPIVNSGVEERSRKDDITEEEIDLLKKSREVLEVKSKLYDKLQKGESIQEEVGDPYLVNFREKLDRVFSEEASSSKQKEHASRETSPDLDDLDEDDDDWVDYVDCLGRTRRCLKEDLESVKERDEAMKKTLGSRVGSNESGSGDVEGGSTAEPIERELEMISSDMQREAMRQKWEEQEQQLLNKKNVYYEDIRFDEARSHGVAYYSFSTEESKREEEQADLKRLREETLMKQKEAKDVKERRDVMKQARLIAARQRQRARLGLPPLPIELETEEKADEVQREEKVEEEEELNREDLEAALVRAAHVRPWDVGKDGVSQPAKILTQEEWVEQKRNERPTEFAPPSQSQIAVPKKNKKKGKKRKGRLQETFIESKKKYEEEEDDGDDDIPGPWPEPGWTSSDIPSNEPCHSRDKEEAGPSGAHLTRGAAIPPPPTFQYYNPSVKTSSSKTPLTMKSSKDMLDSIEAGLEYIKYQSEKRDKIIKDKGTDFQ